MEEKLAREVRFLKVYAGVLTVFLRGVCAGRFRPRPMANRNSDEIDVGRINIVEKDGQIKMVISNRERFPDPGNVVTGKFQKRAGLKSPGITFYNEKGDECGGLIYTSKEEPDGKYLSGSLLALDKYNGDQVMGMQYEEANGKRIVGLNIWDQPDVPVAEQRSNYDAAKKLSPGPEQDTLMQKARAAQRVFIGRGLDRAAKLTLSDANGRTANPHGGDIQWRSQTGVSRRDRQGDPHIARIRDALVRGRSLLQAIDDDHLNRGLARFQLEPRLLNRADDCFAVSIETRAGVGPAFRRTAALASSTVPGRRVDLRKGSNTRPSRPSCPPPADPYVASTTPPAQARSPSGTPSACLCSSRRERVRTVRR